MHQSLTLPEVRFHVGPVRATLWHQATGAYQATLEQQHDQSRRDHYTEVLDATEIPKAILALKKAHDYLKKRETAPEAVGESHAAILDVQPRVP